MPCLQHIAGHLPARYTPPMLDFMRKQSQSYLVYLMFGAIIFVFAVNFGPGSGTNCEGPAHTWAARVNGEAIPQQLFTAEYRQRLEYMRRSAQSSGIELTPELLKTMKLREQIMDQLVNEKVLAEEAAKRGLEVSNEELLKHLKASYKVDSVEFEVYRRWVQRTFQTDVAQFENSVRQQLLADKMRRVVSDPIAITEAEIHDQYNYDHDRVSANVVRFDPADEEAGRPDEAAITAFLTTHEKRIKETFDADKLKYRIPKTVTVSQILKSVAADAPEEAFKAAEKSLVEIKIKIEAGAKFADLAKTDSDDTATKENGGVLGTFKPGEMVPALDAAVASLKEGELSALVKTRMGLHLLRVDKIVQPRQREYDESKREIASEMITQEIREVAAHKKAESLLAALKSGQALETLTATDAEAAQEPAHKRPIRTEVPSIHRGDETVGPLGKAPAVRDALFALPDGESILPKVEKYGRSLFVVVRKDREHPIEADFKKDLETLRDRALWNKRRQVTEEWIKSLRKAAKVEINETLTIES